MSMHVCLCISLYTWTWSQNNTFKGRKWSSVLLHFYCGHFLYDNSCKHLSSVLHKWDLFEQGLSLLNPNRIFRSHKWIIRSIYIHCWYLAPTGLVKVSVDYQCTSLCSRKFGVCSVGEGNVGQEKFFFFSLCL